MNFKVLKFILLVCMDLWVEYIIIMVMRESIVFEKWNVKLYVLIVVKCFFRWCFFLGVGVFLLFVFEDLGVVFVFFVLVKCIIIFVFFFGNWVIEKEIFWRFGRWIVLFLLWWIFLFWLWRIFLFVLWWMWVFLFVLW